jgi:hypothetical protein
MKALVVYSDDVDAEDAATELVANARGKLDGQRPQLGILFAAIDYEAEVILTTLMDAFPGLELIGCTTDGELSSERGFSDDSAVLCLLAGDDVRVASGVARQVSAGPEAAIRESVEEAARRLGGAPRLCLATPTSMTVSDSAVVRALRSVLGPGTPVFGGTAADQWRFIGSRQFFGREVLQDAVPFVLLAGDIRFSFGVSTGWSPLGRDGIVTEAEGNLVKTINGQPATAFYRHYFGDVDISHLGEYPLAVFTGEGNDFYLRASLAIDDAKGWLSFAGDIPAGSRVQITQTTRDEVLRSTREGLHKARNDYPGTAPSLLLCFACSGRKQLLGSRTGEEGQIARELLGDLSIAGFYGYGEIAPIQADGTTHFHNETFVALLLGTA